MTDFFSISECQTSDEPCNDNDDAKTDEKELLNKGVGDEIVEVDNNHSQVITPKKCARPGSWLTTVKGETRDFFKILQEA